MKVDRGAMVGMNSTVTRNIKKFELLAGSPAGYACSSIHNVIHLGYEPNSDRLHEEVYRYQPVSWLESARIINEILNEKCI